jgi:hypothetical protein
MSNDTSASALRAASTKNASTTRVVRNRIAIRDLVTSVIQRSSTAVTATICTCRLSGDIDYRKARATHTDLVCECRHANLHIGRSLSTKEKAHTDEQFPALTSPKPPTQTKPQKKKALLESSSSAFRSGTSCLMSPRSPPQKSGCIRTRTNVKGCIVSQQPSIYPSGARTHRKWAQFVSSSAEKLVRNPI